MGIKLRSWEYWPFEVIYAPVFIYWLYLSLKARSLFFFSAANPGIETGGLMGESKINILNKIPRHLIPKTLFVASGEDLRHILTKLTEAGIGFPLIAKPNIGSRGFLVKKLHEPQELLNYLKQQKIDFLVQEYIAYPMEMSIMYYRFPHKTSGTISSVTLKEYLAVKGDGHSTVLQLIKNFDRAKLQLNILKQTHAHLMDKIPDAGEVVELVPIGNHCRGATFYNGNHLIDEKLIATFDHISHQLDGIYFGRFDLKCADLQGLKQGDSFTILELNGVGAEPAHIYDPSYRLFQAIKDILSQWNVIYQISVYNKRRGQDFMSLGEAYQTLLNLLAYKKLVRS